MSRLTTVITIALFAWLASGCARDLTPPVREAIVLGSPEASKRYASEVEAAGARWRAANAREHGNEFVVYLAGTARSGGGLVHEAMVPARWSGDALAERAAWATADRDRLLEAIRRGLPVQRSLLDGTSAAETIAAVWPAVDSRGVRWQIATNGSVHEAVVCDPSSSTDSECREETLLLAYDRWIEWGPGAGSTFEVYRTGTSLATVRRVFMVHVPAVSDAKRLAYLLSVRNEIGGLAETIQTDKEAGSAVAEAIAVALLALSEKSGTKHLTVLSDLRQTSPDGPFYFERAGVPTGEQFVKWLGAAGLLRDARAIDVIACGAHARAQEGQPALSPRGYVQLFQTWSAAFEAMEARSYRLRSTCDAATFSGGVP